MDWAVSLSRWELVVRTGTPSVSHAPEQKINIWAGECQNPQNDMCTQWRLRSACASWLSHLSLLSPWRSFEFLSAKQRLMRLYRCQYRLIFAVYMWFCWFCQVLAYLLKWNEPPHNKTNKMACAPSEDSHPPRLIREFAFSMKKAWVLSYPFSVQRRLIRLGGCPRWFESPLSPQSFFWFCHEVAQMVIIKRYFWFDIFHGFSCKLVNLLYLTVSTLRRNVYYDIGNPQ